MDTAQDLFVVEEVNRFPLSLRRPGYGVPGHPESIPGDPPRLLFGPRTSAVTREGVLVDPRTRSKDILSVPDWCLPSTAVTPDPGLRPGRWVHGRDMVPVCPPGSDDVRFG